MSFGDGGSLAAKMVAELMTAGGREQNKWAQVFEARHLALTEVFFLKEVSCAVLVKQFYGTSIVRFL
jgi:hypothetical protein